MSGPHLAGCSNRQPSRSGCGCCGGRCPGPSAEGGSVLDTQGSRTHSRGMRIPSVPSPWGRAGRRGSKGKAWARVRAGQGAAGGKACLWGTYPRLLRGSPLLQHPPAPPGQASIPGCPSPSSPGTSCTGTAPDGSLAQGQRPHCAQPWAGLGLGHTEPFCLQMGVRGRQQQGDRPFSCLPSPLTPKSEELILSREK